MIEDRHRYRDSKNEPVDYTVGLSARPKFRWQALVMGLIASFPFWLVVGVAVWLVLGGGL